MRAATVRALRCYLGLEDLSSLFQSGGRLPEPAKHQVLLVAILAHPACNGSSHLVRVPHLAGEQCGHCVACFDHSASSMCVISGLHSAGRGHRKGAVCDLKD